MDIKGKKYYMGEPLNFYISLMTIQNFNVTRDIVFDSEGFYVFPSFQKVSKRHIVESN